MLRVTVITAVIVSKISFSIFPLTGADNFCPASFASNSARWFKNLFGKKQAEVNEEVVVEQQESSNEFKDSIKMTEEEENQLLELQKKYRRGEIAENDLTEEQIDALCDLYDKQIEEIKQSIKMKEDKIAEYKRKIESNNT